MINLNISSTNKKPIYRQIYNQISEKILLGEIQYEYMLPSIRVLAKELRISVITTKRAYEELERDGYVYIIPGKGCFVSKINEGKALQFLLARINSDIEKIVIEAKKINIGKKQLKSLIDERY